MTKTKTPRIRPKVGRVDKRSKSLELGQKYISAQATGDKAGNLTEEIKDVSATRTSLQALLVKRADAKATLAKVNGDVATADYTYKAALTAYATAAGRVADGDSTVLSALGVDGAAKPETVTTDQLAAPVLSIEKGSVDGEVVFKLRRIRGAGAYAVEYKLEPSQPSDPWREGLLSKNSTLSLPGLLPAQLVRARARAIGAAPGPWSAEVVGRAA